MKSNNITQYTHCETFDINQIEQMQSQIAKSVLNTLSRQLKYK